MNSTGPAATTGTSGTGATSGAQAPIRSTGGNSNQGANRSQGVTRTRSGGNGSQVLGRSGARADFAQRASGATVGTTSRGGQAVFANSAPAKGKSASGSKSTAAATPSTRSAAGDLWSGFKPGARSSVFAAEASAKPAGMSGTVVAALAVLGLGLAGIGGAMGFAAVRSRRSKSRSSAGR